MVDYIIWLKNGNCISGMADADVMEKVQNIFGEYDDDDRAIGFEDEKGTVYIKLNRIDVIAINKKRNQQIRGI